MTTEQTDTRPLTNEEIEEICIAHDLEPFEDWAEDTGETLLFISNHSATANIQLAGLTRSELLAWIGGKS